MGEASAANVLASQHMSLSSIYSAHRKASTVVGANGAVLLMQGLEDTAAPLPV